MGSGEGQFTFNEAVDFLYQFVNYEWTPDVQYNSKTYDLDYFQQFLKLTGSPQTGLTSIHIAGTKGKGSTAAMIASILHFNAYSTGLYTSPHLIDIRERIRIDGCMISKTEFAKWVSRIADVIESSGAMPPSGYRTTFECLTAVAFLCFQSRNIDWNIFEVGMGGRLDCTNVVDPELCIITPLGLDHVDSLGNSLIQISEEKAGIFKAGVPVIVAPQPETAMKQLRIHAADKHIELIELSSEDRIQIHSVSHNGSIISVQIGELHIRELFIPLIGLFQIENAVTALRAVNELQRRGKVSVSNDGIRDGFQHLKWPGRLSEVALDGLGFPSSVEHIFVDGAHNPSAAVRLIESLQEILPGKTIDMIIGIPANKDIEGILRVLSKVSRRLIVTRYKNQRSSSISDLAATASRYHSNVTSAVDLQSALSDLSNMDDPPYAVIVTGSLYLVGELYDMINDMEEVENIFHRG